MLEVWDAIAKESPAAPKDINPEVPQKFSRLIERLLSKSPKDRPPDAINVTRLVEIIESEEEQRLMKQAARAARQKQGLASPVATPLPKALPSDVQPFLKIMLISSLVMNFVLMVGLGVLIYLLLTKH
ncbi:MAG TPA: hypothetical protein PLN21_21725 [Gemmatales bacterium]|nr:hypothetical protein [Gemmatales bacterium]